MLSCGVRVLRDTLPWENCHLKEGRGDIQGVCPIDRTQGQDAPSSCATVLCGNTKNDDEPCKIEALLYKSLQRFIQETLQ
jgi:hypothetical protein